MNDTAKLVTTLLLVGGLVVAGVYFIRSKKQQEPEAYTKTEVIKEETIETMVLPETEQTSAQEQPMTDMK